MRQPSSQPTRQTPKNWGLIFSGGGMQCSFGVGAARALVDEHKLPPPKIVVGSSGGAPTAATFASGQLKRAEEVWREEMTRSDIVGRVNGPTSPFKIDLSRVVHILRHEISMLSIYASRTDVYFAATDYDTGQPAYLQANGAKSPQHILKSIRASMGLPFTTGVEELDDSRYVDGDLSTSLSDKIEWMMAQGVENVLAINSVTPDVGRDLYRNLKRAGAEDIIKIMRSRMDNLRRTEDFGQLVIDPSGSLPCGLFGPNGFEQIGASIDQGYRAVAEDDRIAAFADKINA
jgi:predicted acylesterase/phospholipase RssA